MDGTGKEIFTDSISLQLSRYTGPLDPVLLDSSLATKRVRFTGLDGITHPLWPRGPVRSLRLYTNLAYSEENIEFEGDTLWLETDLSFDDWGNLLTYSESGHLKDEYRYNQNNQVVYKQSLWGDSDSPRGKYYHTYWYDYDEFDRLKSIYIYDSLFNGTIEFFDYTSFEYWDNGNILVQSKSISDYKSVAYSYEYEFDKRFNLLSRRSWFFAGKKGTLDGPVSHLREPSTETNFFYEIFGDSSLLMKEEGSLVPGKRTKTAIYKRDAQGRLLEEDTQYRSGNSFFFKYDYATDGKGLTITENRTEKYGLEDEISQTEIVSNYQYDAYGNATLSEHVINGNLEQKVVDLISYRYDNFDNWTYMNLENVSPMSEEDLELYGVDPPLIYFRKLTYSNRAKTRGQGMVKIERNQEAERVRDVFLNKHGF